MPDNHDVERVVEDLVRRHFELEANLEKVIWIRSNNKPGIRLLEVNSDTFATGMVQSFYLRPSNDVPFPLYIAEVTPEEWQRIQRDEIELQEGWSLDDHKVFSREMVLA